MGDVAVGVASEELHFEEIAPVCDQASQVCEKASAAFGIGKLACGVGHGTVSILVGWLYREMETVSGGKR